MFYRQSKKSMFVFFSWFVLISSSSTFISSFIFSLSLCPVALVHWLLFPLDIFSTVPNIRRKKWIFSSIQYLNMKKNPTSGKSTGYHGYCQLYGSFVILLCLRFELQNLKPVQFSAWLLPLVPCPILWQGGSLGCTSRWFPKPYSCQLSRNNVLPFQFVT